MAQVVVLGAGVGGTLAAYELRDMLGADHMVSVATKGRHLHFVPSDPWVGVGWRDNEAIEVDLEAVFAKRRKDLIGGGSVSYDYLVIAAGPDLAFDEFEGFGPTAHTQSICVTDHALKAKGIEKLKEVKFDTNS